MGWARSVLSVGLSHLRPNLGCRIHLESRKRMVSALAIPWIILLLLPLGAAAPQQRAATSTRSPHGALNIPCQNCHTFSGWKPIRAVPEFDHNQTHYPLRGMHKGV